MKKLFTKIIGFQKIQKSDLRLVMILFLSISYIKLSAQDIILLRDASEIQAKILEINTTEVKYKKLDNPDGPTYTLLKSDILVIKYPNGSKDVFQEKAPEVVAPKEDTYTAPVGDVKSGNKDFIITKGGERIDCIIDVVETNRIKYHVKRKGKDTREIIAMTEVSEYMQQNVVRKVRAINDNTKTNDDFVEMRRHYSGPRVGMTFTGPGALYDALEVEGKRSYYSQFGWQFETRMFTLENGLSGMLEFVPLVGGIDMGKFIPSFSGLIGIRTKEGFEFGLGPNWGIYFGKKANGTSYATSNLGVVLAVGMSIKSGKVYFPLNLAVVPSITKQTRVYDPASGNTVTKSYQTGLKVTLLIGFNNRSR